MCYLLFAKKIETKTNNDLIKKILKEQSSRNSDGFGMYNSEGFKHRSLSYKTFSDKIDKSLKCNWSAFHLRYKTTGDIAIHNVHMFGYKDYTFAHNGMIDEFSYYNSKKSDSKLYFENLVNSLKCQDKMHIAKRIKKSKFYDGGRCFLTTPNNDIYLFGDFNVYLVGGWLLVSSTSLYFNDKKKKIDFGDLKMSGNVMNGDLDGIYKLEGLNFEHLGDIPTKKREIGFKYHNYDPSGYNNDMPTTGLSKKYQEEMKYWDDYGKYYSK